jgi:hypothetical protein
MSVTIQIENVESSNDLPVDNHIPLDDPIDTVNKNGPVSVRETEVDCFGRSRTAEEIKERSKFRENTCFCILSLTLLVIFITFPITMLVSLPDNGNVNALFIISAIIVCSTWGPIVIGVIGVILYLIGGCCYQLL